MSRISFGTSASYGEVASQSKIEALAGLSCKLKFPSSVISGASNDVSCMRVWFDKGRPSDGAGYLEFWIRRTTTGNFQLRLDSANGGGNSADIATSLQIGRAHV
jgi:hypothetical protein